MAQSARELRIKLVDVRNNLTDIVGDALVDNKEAVTGYVKSQLYNEGIDKDGKPIQPPYSFATVEIKRKKGQRNNWVTFYDTGETYNKMYVDRKGDTVDIKSTSVNYPKLLAKYGDRPFGLTDENKRALWVSTIRSIVVQQIAQRTGVKTG